MKRAALFIFTGIATSLLLSACATTASTTVSTNGTNVTASVAAEPATQTPANAVALTPTQIATNTTPSHSKKSTPERILAAGGFFTGAIMGS